MWIAELTLLAVVAFIQNMAFTWVSRSRNSGDPNYHRLAAWCSNGIWFAANLLVFRQIWVALVNQEFWRLAVVGLVYVIATSEGSVLMMRLLLKREKGARRVGAYTDPTPGNPDRAGLRGGVHSETDLPGAKDKS